MNQDSSVSVCDIPLPGEEQLRDELTAGGFFAVYQPFVNVDSGRVQGFEAFVRRRVTGPAYGASSLLAAVQESDLVCDLDAWVMREALEQLAQWHASAGATDLVLSINVAARHVAQPRIVADVVAALQSTGVEADRLLVDVAPSVLRDDEALPQLQTLRCSGVALCLDSLDLVDNPGAHLAGSVDIVKLNPGWLDRSRTPRDVIERFVRSVQDAGLPLVAGGIESLEHLSLAQHLGCEWVQGYFLGEPVRAAEVHLP